MPADKDRHGQREGDGRGDRDATTPRPGRGGTAHPDARAPAPGSPGPTRTERAIRRGLKLAGLGVLAYYALPAKIFGVRVEWSFVLGAGVVALVELARLTRAVRLPAVRAYEERRPAGYVYWALALAVLVAFFPEGIAVSALVAAAVTDILAGELRTLGLAPARVRVGTVVLFATLAGLLSAPMLPQEPLLPRLLAAVAGGLVAAAVEGRRWSALDDDLLLPLLPALLWMALFLLVPGSRPLAFHLPWSQRG